MPTATRLSTCANCAVDTQRSELRERLVDAFEQLWQFNADTAADKALEVICADAAMTIDVLADVSEFVASLVGQRPTT